ncbi:MAG: FtsX-like permease family protein [Flavobacteriales bacterium]|nr:FtsX-like permease family protein [Flavobacteriales bacterium]
MCIIGKNIKTRFFPSEDPIGKYLKCGKVWLRIIGVLQERLISDDAASHLGIRNYNMDVYTPMETVLIRYRNRGMLTKAALERAANPWGNDDETTKDPLNAKDNHNQIDRLVIQVNSTDELKGAADVISRLLERRHNGVVDFEVVIPELMLRQEQETKKMFRNVLAAIAGISLLIGGIGIMNIMLASVLERTKEIGLRLSIGATKDDVVMQFLMESVTISLVGGLSGIILGIGLSVLIDVGFGIATVISPVSVFLSFFISAMVGLIFGIAPARRAAMQDPIKSLRYE